MNTSTADLRAAALRHLERFSCSVDGLRRVLQRKLTRTARREGSDAVPEDGAASIETVLAALVRAGLLNDDRYAEGRVAALARRGMSLRRIKADLMAHGLAAELAEDVLARHAEETCDAGAEPDIEAARTYARRRRLGVFRETAASPDDRRRDLAALARAGFSYEVATAIVDGNES
jgi:regulatory protein